MSRRKRSARKDVEPWGAVPVDHDPSAPVDAPDERQDEPAVPVSEPVLETAKPSPMRVAPGKSVTSLRGLLKAGTEVTRADFAGGESSIERLLVLGAIVRS